MCGQMADILIQFSTHNFEEIGCLNDLHKAPIPLQKYVVVESAGDDRRKYVARRLFRNLVQEVWFCKTTMNLCFAVISA